MSAQALTLRNRYTGEILYQNLEPEGCHYLYGIVLKDCDLKGVNLACVNMRDAYTEGSNIREADLSEIKEDFFARMSKVTSAIPSLREAVASGKINGDRYYGTCGCFMTVVSRYFGVEYDEIPNLKPDEPSPTEQWFYALREGDDPENSQISAITLEWIDEFLARETHDKP